MAKCKQCNTVFHACNGCGFEDWEWIFCSTKCRETFREFSEDFKRTREILSKLSDEDLNWLFDNADEDMYDYCIRKELQTRVLMEGDK
jgi:hypothetical protein